MNTSRTNGFSIVEVVIILVVVVLIATLGYFGWNAFMKNNDNQAIPAVVESQATTEIITEEDLELAEKELNSLEFEDKNMTEAQAEADL